MTIAGGNFRAPRGDRNSRRGSCGIFASATSRRATFCAGRKIHGTASHRRIRRSQRFAPDIGRLVEIRCKYAGYIARESKAIERFAQLEKKLIPPLLDYAQVSGLRNEARQKLIKFTPRSLGQAMRISGITPADVTLLAIHLSRTGT